MRKFFRWLCGIKPKSDFPSLPPSYHAYGPSLLKWPDAKRAELRAALRNPLIREAIGTIQVDEASIRIRPLTTEDAAARLHYLNGFHDFANKLTALAQPQHQEELPEAWSHVADDEDPHQTPN